MTTATPTQPTPRAPAPAAERSIPSGRGPDLTVGALAAAGMAAATCWLLGLPTSHLIETMGLYAVLAGLILRHLPPGHGRAGIGPANRVTLLRATLVLPVAALALHPRPLGAAGYAWIVALAAAAMALDGLDGKVARRTGTSSGFGARFDMELDALLLMALSLLLWQGGKVGSWVILIGALRYLFVLAGLLWSPLRADLPDSLRRKAVCVWQGVSILLALAPVTPAALAALVAAIALALLVWSFAVDVRWLAERAPAASAHG
jgi:phosphatidylglycerophosphate synthase